MDSALGFALARRKKCEKAGSNKIRTTEEISATCLLYLPSYFTKSDTARVAAASLFSTARLSHLLTSETRWGIESNVKFDQALGNTKQFGQLQRVCAMDRIPIGAG
ncbi:MAG: hypothetical protein ACRD9Y_21540 [Blastocatellia bacterium]